LNTAEISEKWLRAQHTGMYFLSSAIAVHTLSPEQWQTSSEDLTADCVSNLAG